MTATPIAPDPIGDESFTGRLFLLLKAAMTNPVCSTDDAMLRGEDTGRRLGDPKAIGRAVAYAHQRGWIRPLPARQEAARLIKKSVRPTRACGPVELWVRTEKTPAAFEMLKRRLTTVPPPKGLFDSID